MLRKPYVELNWAQVSSSCKSHLALHLVLLSNHWEWHSRKMCQALIIRLPLMISAAISVFCLHRVSRASYVCLSHTSPHCCSLGYAFSAAELTWIKLNLRDHCTCAFPCRVSDEFAFGDYPLMHVSESQVSPHCQFSICSMWIIILSCLTWVLWALIS